MHIWLTFLPSWFCAYFPVVVVTFLCFGLGGGAAGAADALAGGGMGGSLDLGKPSRDRFSSRSALHGCTSPSSSNSISTELTGRRRTAEESQSFRTIVGVQTSGWQGRLEATRSRRGPPRRTRASPSYAAGGSSSMASSPIESTVNKVSFGAS